MLSTAVLLVASMAVGQAEEPNVAYEQLKALEPMIGTWHGTGETADGTSKWEAKITYSWVEGQKTIKAETLFRMGKPDEDLAKLAWDPGSIIYTIWNAKTKQIERYRIRPDMGDAMVQSCLPKGDGVFVVQRVWPTGEAGAIPVNTMKITSKEWTMKVTNRTDDDGQALDDLEYTFTKLGK